MYLKNNLQFFHFSFYILGLIKFEILKIYLRINLINSFTYFFKFAINNVILFAYKK